MTMALGGHVSEEMVFGEMTTGAHDDIGKVTQIARNMVTQWGMSSRLGPRTFGKRQSMVFLGRDISEERDYSERTAEEIDDEVRRIIDEAHDRCRTLMAAHRDRLDALAQRLIEVETVEGDDLLELLGPAEGRPRPGEIPSQSQPGVSAEPKAPESSDEEEEAPQGRPGLAWGQGGSSSE